MKHSITQNYSFNSSPLFIITSILCCLASFVACDPSPSPNISLVLANTGEIEISASEIVYIDVDDNGLKVVAADKAETLDWDFSTEGISSIKSNTYGSSQAGIQIVQKLFNEVVEAPEAGYKTTISGYEEWASYNVQTHSLVLTAGRTFIVKTADGKYAKFKIDKLAAAASNPTTRQPTSYRISFTISYQKEAGNRKLAN